MLYRSKSQIQCTFKKDLNIGINMYTYIIIIIIYIIIYILYIIYNIHIFIIIKRQLCPSAKV